ncbi:MAG: hypothetical protein WCW78_03575 [Candidatus Paceibacterota bacterium]|jgi:hypothetical protein
MKKGLVWGLIAMALGIPVVTAIVVVKKKRDRFETISQVSILSNDYDDVPLGIGA